MAEPAHADRDQPSPGQPKRGHTEFGEPQGDEPEQALQAALDGLSRMSLGTQTLEISLQRIAGLAVTAVPGAEGAGIAMIEERHSETVGSSDPFVAEIDGMQYGLRQGPCISAAAERQTIVSGALESDSRWPRFAARARRTGVRSVLSIPLVLDDGEVTGAMNVYARTPDAFSTESVRLGQMFAISAAVAVQSARALMQARRLVEQLRTALTSRATIDQAIGIVMSRQGGSPDDAFATLTRISQNQNIKLAVVAQEIVREAVQRARARHGGAAPSPR